MNPLQDDFLIPCGVPLSNAHPAHIERPDKVGAHGLPDADYAAAAYEKEMMATTIIQKHPLFLGKPSFDLILLGTGDDGHCASLNPQTEQINDTSGRSVLPIQPVQVGGGLPAEQAASSDKPAGVTFSMGLINNAQRVVVSAGEKKRATMVLRALTRSMPGEVCPASLVQCIGTTTWITDSDSMAAYKAAAH